MVRATQIRGALQTKRSSERWEAREGGTCSGSRRIKGRPITAYRDMSWAGS